MARRRRRRPGEGLRALASKVSTASAAARWRIRPGRGVDLAAIDAGDTGGAPGDKDATVATFPHLHGRLAVLQEQLFAEQSRSLLVVLQAIDAGGKDGTVKHLFKGLNPSSCRVVSFRAPSEEELAHDFLWRVHRHVPARGEVAVFNRSHYEDVLVVRVHELVPESAWRPRYGLIRHFEENLAAAGTTVVKLFLHISPDEQAERFRDRLADPTKQWKFRRGDLDDRARWTDFEAAFAEAIEETTTDGAPWYVVPADRKWFRNWAVSQILVETLEVLGPRYPPPPDDLAGVVIE
ncbi:MAG: PPK2 family polyphosphate kinase [Acidimicrobiales bacterium]